MLDLGDTVESLGGRYVTAEDVGTSPADMAVIAERTCHVVGLPPERGGGGDPSPLTARGVLAAIHASLEYRTGDHSLAGRRVCVVGLGHVGLALAELLADVGAELAVTDIDAAKRADAERLGARWLDPGDAIDEPLRRARSLRARRRDRHRRRPAPRHRDRLRIGEQRARPRGRRSRARPTAGSSTRPTSSPTPAG